MTDAVQRRLVAILAADVVGYSRSIRLDEVGTLIALKALWADIFDPAVTQFRGRIFKSMGDGKLVEFTSAVDAVRCAIAIQEMAESSPLLLRIGVHVGDVVVEGDDILGDGVNIAARLEKEAPSRGIVISDAVHDQIRGKIQAGFADAGLPHLKNIDHAIRAWKWIGNASASNVAGAPESPLPSLAVLPFANLSNDPEQEFFVDGLVEDIITTLSKLSGLTVIARNSTFLYKGRAVDVREIARELGVRFVLEGSVRRNGNRMRITTQLIDADTGGHVWAERFDRDVDDIFALQDELTLILATELQVRLTEGEQARVRYTTTHNVAAWTLWAQGLAHYRTGTMTKDGMGRARSCWEGALALDPQSSELHAMLANLRVADARLGWWGDRANAIAIGKAHVKAALELNPDNADAHISAGMLLRLDRQFDEAVDAVRKARSLAPGSADIAAFAATVLTAAGCHEEAVEAIERAMRLSPKPPPNYLGIAGLTYRLAGRDADALAAFTAYSERSAGFGHLDLAIIHHRAGRISEARAAVAHLLSTRPQVSVRQYAATQVRRDNAEVDEDVSALRAAGLPD